MNSSGKKVRFDYEEYEDNGARVIAIGGMVLSRGLTLEGLMVSYYSRNAGTYDTLLQMCRWFGYRPGYEDLCRVYLSQLNIDRFDAVLTATEDLKIQFAEMERNGKSPKDFGLMIRESPETLETSMLVTARNKMRGSEQIVCHLNYGGVYADTSKIKRDEAVNNHNLELTRQLHSKVHFEWKKGRYYMASEVSKNDVAAFIKELKIPYINKKFDTEGLSQYIEQSTIFDVWDIVIASGDGFSLTDSLGVDSCKAALRSFHISDVHDQYVRIGGTNNRVLDPSTFNAGLWLSKEKQELILEEKQRNDPTKVYSNLTASDYLKYRSNPILVIYPIELKKGLSPQEDKKEEAYPGEKVQIEAEKAAIIHMFGENTPVMAYAIGFPYREEKVMVTYRANLVKLNEFTQNLEMNDDGEGEEENEDD